MTWGHTVSFRHAGEGLWYALRTQPNFLIHLAISLAVIGAGVWFKLERGEWVVIILTIALGLAIELINTAIETGVDLVTDQVHPLAKITKDTASAAMLVYAVGAVLIGLVIFVPKFL